MKNLKISMKLFVAFGIIVVFFLSASSLGLISVFRASQSYEYFYQTPYKNRNQAISMSRSIQAVAKFTVYSISTDDTEKVTNYINSAKAELELVKEGMAYIDKNSSIDKNIIKSFYNAMEKAKAPREKVFQLSLSNQNVEALKVYFNEYYPLMVEENSYLEKIAEFASNNADNTYSKATKEVQLLTIALITIVAITILVTVIIAIKLSTGLRKPIVELEAAARKLAAGHLQDAKLTYESKDELGSLSESMRITIGVLTSIIKDEDELLEHISQGNFNVKTKIKEKYIGDFNNILKSMTKITTSLSDTMSQITQVSSQVSTGSDQVSNGAQALSQGATEQASSVEELAATISEISSNVKINATSAQEAKDTVEKVGGQLMESNAQMGEMKQAMDDISNSSAQIGKIIKTIEDIAFQTNILALNAAVEAARAGTAGKGFAVVANEVRSLASKSSEASKSTSTLIENSIKAVERGTKIVGQTAVSLLTVVTGTEQITTQMTQIAHASEDQAQAILQVTMGVDQISSVIQTNSATAQESAAASEELSSQSQMLKNLVEHFKLRTNL